MLTHSKQKGNIGEAKCLAALVSLGNPVLLPFGDNERYDLVVESKTGELLKAQIKYSSQISPNGSLDFALVSSKNHTTNKIKDSYEEEIDIFLLYHSVVDQIFVLNKEQFKGKKSINFRLTEAKNGQTKGINFAQDFLLKERI